MIYSILMLQELLQNVTPTPIPPNPNAIGIKDILGVLGAALGFISTLLIFFLTRRNKKIDDRSDEQKAEDKKNREDRNEILKNCKDEREIAKKEHESTKKELEELSLKYDQIYEAFMATKIELAVIQFEHELLYSKLSPEEASIIKERVGKFKDNLTDMAMKGKEEREQQK